MNPFVAGMLVGCLVTVCLLSVAWNVLLATSWSRWIDRLVTLANIKRDQDAQLEREKIKREAVREIAEIRAKSLD